MICLISSLIIGGLIMYSGPAFDDFRLKRRLRKDYPKAKAIAAKSLN